MGCLIDLPLIIITAQDVKRAHFVAMHSPLPFPLSFGIYYSALHLSSKWKLL